MSEKVPEELERRVEQARRILSEATDPLTRDRVEKLLQELEKQLQEGRV
jgi:TATA-binding protein-associated factor Taf7